MMYTTTVDLSVSFMFHFLFHFNCTRAFNCLVAMSTVVRCDHSWTHVELLSLLLQRRTGNNIDNCTRKLLAIMNRLAYVTQCCQFSNCGVVDRQGCQWRIARWTHVNWCAQYLVHLLYRGNYTGWSKTWQTVQPSFSFLNSWCEQKSIDV